MIRRNSLFILTLILSACTTAPKSEPKPYCFKIWNVGANQVGPGAFSTPEQAWLFRGENNGDYAIIGVYNSDEVEESRKY